MMGSFDEYRRLGEPDKAEKVAIWETAIGLQDVDGLKPSEYLIETAKNHIDGDITIDEVQNRISSYYQRKDGREESETRTEEADKVSARIAEILGEKSFTFSPAELVTIHKRLFDGIYKFAGMVRDFDISKKEWVLDGDTVYYAGSNSIRETLDYDFSAEKAFSYRGLTQDQTIKHIAKFVSGIWQIHPFGEGNTRTTAVFIIKYLRTLGFPVNNELFKDNSWYFRNALVRANYNILQSGTHSSTEYLERFFRNLLLGETNALKNRDLHIKADDSVKARLDSVNDSVNDSVFALIKKDPSVTVNEIAKELGISPATVHRQLKRLKINGLIARIGSDKTGSWKIMSRD